MGSERKGVSVVIVAGDQNAGVEAAVESVLAQDYGALEVIVAAPDATDSLTALKDERLIHIRPGHQGRAVARNAALRRASGDYVAFLGPEDRYLPGKLARQVDYLETHPALGIVYAATIGIDTAGQPLGQGDAATVAVEVDAQIAFCAPLTNPLSTVMVRRSVLDAIGPCDERLDLFDDIDLWRRMARHSGVGAIPEPLAEVRVDAGDAAPDEDPTVVLGAYSYYIDKVARENSDVDPLVRGASARRLGEHAAARLLGVPSHRPFGELLQHQARRYFHPKVSIVIPVYNGANYLGDAIRSAFAQTYDNIEVIVVNDGSNDGGATERVARGFGDRIRYITKPNGGVASALNRGIDEMTGDYFSWLSHDDLYLPDKLTVQVGALARMPDPSRCVMYSDYGVFSADPAQARPFILDGVAPKDFRYYITVTNAVHGCTLLVPRQAFSLHGRFNTALRTTQDYDLWFRIAETFAFVHQPVIFVHARSHPDQGTLALSDLVLGECNALLTGFVENLSAAEVRAGATASLGEGYLRIASNFARRGFDHASARAAELWRQSLTPDELPGVFRRHLDFMVELERSGAEIARLAAENAYLVQQRDEAREQVRLLRHELDVIHGSRSWSLTAPLREANAFVGRLTR
jgi:glycosyltransferase involved in cell wall biosynthesis